MFPAIPERLRAFFDAQVPGFWSWWQAAKKKLDLMESQGGALAEFPIGMVVLTEGNTNPADLGIQGTWEAV